MFFTDVLDIHDSFHQEGSLGDILGDGYLMQANPVYRKVRSFSLKIGCKYVEAYPDYLLLPFHELPVIVERKEIPYVPAARLMKKVESGQPGVFTTDDVPMPESYHLHEAAHVIAEHCFKNVAVKTSQEQILKSILAESFANAVDALVWNSVGDDVHHYFVQQNSYMHPQKKVIRALAGLSDTMGLRYTFMLTFFGYVHANFMVKPMSKKFVHGLAERYAPNAKVSSSVQKNIQAVSEMGEKLDRHFRLTTTGNYFKQQGLEGEICDLLDFPFMKVFADNRTFGEATEALAGSIA